jgi:hypothetical protein
MPEHLEFAQLPDPTDVTHTEDYEIALEIGALSAGTENSLTFRITLKGQDAEQLDPYLGILGHLLALREDDSPSYTFIHWWWCRSTANISPVFPSIGRYRMFRQFTHKGPGEDSRLHCEGSP